MLSMDQAQILARDEYTVSPVPSLPQIPAEEMCLHCKNKSDIIDAQAETIQELKTEIQQLRDEIAILKGEKSKPVLKPSKMDKNTDLDDNPPHSNGSGVISKRPGSAKRSKTAQLIIHEIRIIKPAGPIPSGARLKSYQNFVVQGLIIKAHNICYRLACYQTNDGKCLRGQLPPELQGQHFNPTLRNYILYQHHHCHVTQPLLLEQLSEWHIDISSGQINALLSQHTEPFHTEKDEILAIGLQKSQYVTVDDTGARHAGQNGYALHVGNEDFGWFQSTDSKSRINFLQCLHAGPVTTQVNEHALTYMEEHGLSNDVCSQLQDHATPEFLSIELWRKHLEALKIDSETHVRIATEGALLGSLVEKGFNLKLAIVSDGAGQFAVLLHALCWIHAERLVHKLIPVNEGQRQAVAQVRSDIWRLYGDLKAYKRNPNANMVEQFEKRFDSVFNRKTGYQTLDNLLKRLYGKKEELLLVLQRPEIPLHTNGSETALRDLVKKRKVSGGTRSDLGRQCRDTFASLKKTCRKQGISFWRYLEDRITQTNAIPRLATLIRT
ncbi:transposase [Candidatus Symbiobacter mobilis CR]|uniref:Transposase n=2 Tax=Candidatus Symbiobacter TaxID=1436289 RepID=U5NAR1_9BURK|nr:transposase [Candidatus Symbiobacter mobilis CR]